MTDDEKTHSYEKETTQPRVVIIGGGFGGLSAARGLAGAPVSVTLIDKRNYHLFRPMLYPVATGCYRPTKFPRGKRKEVDLRFAAANRLDFRSVETASRKICDFSEMLTS